jgi:ribosome biogenesis GTPase A
MDCPKCNLRYNTSIRKPKISHCGHTVCEACGNKILLCPLCQVTIEKSKLNINHSLMQMLEEKKILRDIDKFIKVCFVGESKVGKTSLINRLKGQEYK